MVISIEEADDMTPLNDVARLDDDVNLDSITSEAPTLIESPIGDSPHDFKRLLLALPFFANLTPLSADLFLEDISNSLHLRKCKPGDIVIRQGEQARAVFFIIRGSLKVVSDDGEIELADLSAGSYFGEIGIMFRVLRTANVVARSHCVLLTLTAEEIDLKLLAYPEVKQGMTEAAQIRLLDLAKEYEKYGRVVPADLIKQLKHVEALPLEHLWADPSRTHSIEALNHTAVLDTVQPINIASSLRMMLAEKRRASIAVWSDDKLIQFAKNAVAETIVKESRFANSNSSLVSSSLSSQNFDLLLEGVSRVGLFSLEVPSIVKILSYLEINSLLNMKRANKCLSALVLERDFGLFQALNLTPYNKKIDDVKLTKIVLLYGDLVENLSLRNCWSLTDAGLFALASSSTRLTTLDLSNVWDLTDVGVVRIVEKNPLLNSLTLSNCRKITDIAISTAIACLMNLSTLNVSYCKMLTGKMLESTSWSNLRNVNFQRCTGIKDDGFQQWQQESLKPNALSFASLNFYLEDLNLSDCSFLTDATILAISAKCPRLVKLSLSFCCSLTEAFAPPLSAGCPFIEILDLSYCGGAATDSAIKILAVGLTKLKGIGLRGCIQLTDLGVKSLAKHAQSLNTVNLTQCKNVSRDICKELKVNWNSLSNPMLETIGTLKNPNGNWLQ